MTIQSIEHRTDLHDPAIKIHGTRPRRLAAGHPRRPVPQLLRQATPVPGVTKIALSGSTVLVRAPVVTMPNVVGELRASAVGHLQAIGLSVQVSTVPDPDRRCDHVGYVESQTPPPGTVVAPGGHATIRVYVPPPAGCL
jgi:hypothetical protein